MRLTYAGFTILTDPFLAARHTLRTFAGQGPNPTVDLPISAAEVVEGVDLVLVSHLHVDHFDETAQAILNRDLPLLCQPGDEVRIEAAGFTRVRPVSGATTFHGIQIARTPGRHGSGAMAERMGNVSGFLLRATGEPTVYWAGDTVWYEAVANTIRDAKPDVIITHSSGAQFEEGGPIIMDADQTLAACASAPAAVVVAVHLESLDHGRVDRESLRAAADAAGISPQRLRIPLDGEIIIL